MNLEILITKCKEMNEKEREVLQNRNLCIVCLLDVIAALCLGNV